MRFGVLGPLSVQAADGAELVLPGTGPRVTLAVLLVHANRAVPVDTLVEAVWQGRPPRSWASNIQTYISRLRHALPGLDVRFDKQAYRLRVDHCALDLAEFWADVETARKWAADGEYPRAAARFRTALGHWRGEPLGNLQIPPLEPELTRLSRERLTVVEDCLDAELAAGRHADVIGELRILVARHPDRDRLAAQLMLALARCGRVDDATAVYRASGTEPGPELRRLYLPVLRGEVPVPRPAAARTPFPVCQLPPDVPNLTGRGALVADLLAHLGNGGAVVPLVAVDGPPGVGKTALAVHLAHRTKAGYADGQLYADLAGGARDPFDVLAEWLHALGVTGRAVPAGLAARAAALRSRLADRRVLVVLDDAADATQVQPLVPGTPGSAVVLTSRSRVTGLAATAARSLVPLRSTESRALLGGILGPARVTAERTAAERVAAACGHLPLPLRIAAAHADTGLAALAEELDREGAVALARAALDEPARRALRRLSLLGPVDVADWAMAALDAAEPAGRLVAAHLLEPVGHGRFRVPGPVRDQLAEPAADRDEMLSEVRRHAVALTARAAAAVPRTVPLPRLEPDEPPPAVPEELARRVDRDPAAWLAAERAGLLVLALAACHDGGYRHAARLLDRLAGYLLDQQRTADVSRIAGMVRDAADRSGDSRTATWATLLLARAQGEAGLATLRRAVGAGERHGYHDLLAWALVTQSGYERSASLDVSPEAPLRSAQRSAALFGELGDRVGLAQALRATALALSGLGRVKEAEAAVAEGVDVARAVGDQIPLATLLSTQGGILLAARDARRAQRVGREALRLFREAGAQPAVCQLLGQLARISATLGERSQAQRYLAEARATALLLDEPLQSTLLLRDTAASWLGDGYPGEAVPVLRRCVRTLVELGQRRRAAVTQRVVAAAYDALGDTAAAAAAVAEAEAIGGALDTAAGEQLRQILLLARVTSSS